MKTYHYNDYPMTLLGLPKYSENGKLERVPEKVRKAVPSLEFLGRRIPGSRLCFRTNANKIRIDIKFDTLSPDIGMAIYSCQTANVFAGRHDESRFIGIVHPNGYSELDKIFGGEVYKGNDEMEDIVIFIPRNEIISDISVSVDDDRVVEKMTAYKYSKPIVYYGSSIVEGGCCCNISNCYNAIISRRLDTDYINLGFSGAAKGETEMAEYINSIDMSIFVLDYDYNAPTAEHLRNTHEPFFKAIRKANPNLPIIMMSRPCINITEDEKIRRDIIKTTNNNALADGDKNAYFIDGETFYGESDRELCSIDLIHPNDLGFYRMANVVEPVIKSILENINE